MMQLPNIGSGVCKAVIVALLPWVVVAQSIHFAVGQGWL